MFRVEEATAQGTRTARTSLGDDDQPDIPGFVTAFHLSVAGLPRSSVGDHGAASYRRVPQARHRTRPLGYGMHRWQVAAALEYSWIASLLLTRDEADAHRIS
jgi:hypothetical protein